MKKQTLNRDELESLLRLAFSAGISTGKKLMPIEQIPMGSKIRSTGAAFKIFFDKLCSDIEKGEMPKIND